MQPLLTTPINETVLLDQAHAVAGYRFGELAALAGIPIPQNLKRDKGWVGGLLERWLGASAGSKPEQDFSALGIELKTIPVDSLGRPLETTFVCVAPLTGNNGVTWETSHVRHKLKIRPLPAQSAQARYWGFGLCHRDEIADADRGFLSLRPAL